MNALPDRQRNYLPAMVCVLLTAVAMVLIWPVAEMGVMDDWSYVFTAQELARTGHVHYNGWATAMLGWPLYVGAAAVRLAGFSFTAVRLTTMLEGLLCVALLQRVFARGGLSTGNAVLGTLTVALSPVFLLMSTTFMSDVPGLLAVVVCLYCCMRALASDRSRLSFGWIVTACVLNTVLGTARQIAWLGVLVMVPAALWRLRQRRSVVPDGLVWAASVAGIFALLHWFNRQPYSVPESLVPGRLSVGALGHGLQMGSKFLLDTALLCLPVLVGLVPALWRLRGRRLAMFAVGSLLTLGLAARFAVHGHLHEYAVPALHSPRAASTEDLFSNLIEPPKGPTQSPLPVALIVFLSLASFVGVFAGLAAAFVPAGRPEKDGPRGLSFPDVCALCLPFLASYCLLLAPRAAFAMLFDRYSLSLMPVLLLLLLRLAQCLPVDDRRWMGVPASVVLATIAVYSTLAAHDFYAVYRASLQGVQMLQSAGVPRQTIDGGWEYDRTTELLESGFVLYPNMRLPDGTSFQQLRLSKPVGPCAVEYAEQIPHVAPRYSLAYGDAGCVPVEGFAPVHFHTWLPPHDRVIQIVQTAQQGW